MIKLWRGIKRLILIGFCECSDVIRIMVINTELDYKICKKCGTATFEVKKKSGKH